MDSDAIVVTNVTVQRRWRRRLWPVPWLLVPVLSVAWAAEWPPWALALLSALFLASLVAALATVRGAGATLRVGAEGLHFATGKGERVLARSAIRRALVVVDGVSVALGVEPRVGSFVEFVLPGAGAIPLETAELCVDRLGFGTDRRVLLFTNPTALARAFVTWLLGAALALVVVAVAQSVIGRLGAAPFALLVAALATLLARSSRTIDLAVGADGVELRGPWRTEFISYDAVAWVRWGSNARLEIGAASGEPRRITGTSLLDDPAMAEAFVHAVDRARSRYAARRRNAAIAALLERRGRPLAEWRDSLRALVEVGGGYRAHALGAADLAALLADPTAEEELRVGAAVALRALDPASESTRIRVAAEACAHAPLRAALELAAADALDDAAVAKLRARRGEVG